MTAITMTKKLLIKASLLCVIVIFFSKRPVLAEGISLGIYPPVVQIESLQPTEINADLTLENKGDAEITAEIKFKPFRPGPKEDGSLEYITPTESYQALLNKTQIREGEHVLNFVTLSPKQQKKLTLHLGLSKDITAGDYYFSVLFLIKQGISEDIEADSSKQNSSLTTGGIASNILLSVGQREKINARITEFSTLPFFSHGPVAFKLRLENQGEQAISPTGSIFIRNLFGQYVGKLDLLPVNVLAKSIRSLPDSKTLEPDSLSALYNTSSPYALWPEKFLFGYYTAGVYLKLSDNGPVLTESVHFFAFPWQGIMLIFILVSLFLLTLRKVKLKLKE